MTCAWKQGWDDGQAWVWMPPAMHSAALCTTFHAQTRVPPHGANPARLSSGCSTGRRLDRMGRDPGQPDPSDPGARLRTGRFCARHRGTQLGAGPAPVWRCRRCRPPADRRCRGLCPGCRHPALVTVAAGLVERPAGTARHALAGPARRDRAAAPAAGRAARGLAAAPGGGTGHATRRPGAGRGPVCLRGRPVAGVVGPGHG